MKLRVSALLVLIGVSTCPAPGLAAAEPPKAAARDAGYFPAEPNADFILETAVADARESGKLAVVVFGADWCHDSRFLAQVLTSAEFAEAYGKRFAVTFIDVGKPQTGEGHNLDLVAGLGVRDLKSTPALFVLNGLGKPLNSARDAVSWRTAEKRGKAAILGYFKRFR